MKCQCTLCDEWFANERVFVTHLKWWNVEHKPGPDGNYRRCEINLDEMAKNSEGRWNFKRQIERGKFISQVLTKTATK